MKVVSVIISVILLVALVGFMAYQVYKLVLDIKVKKQQDIQNKNIEKGGKK